ncbi:MAG: SUMF1/EgtB/PvdO family nonheme iron enzyme [Planctomycetota bacterium]|nr:SUMF1/EgtB/PvdO family nonheme iron enzyme [Planctomycetota bacterium]MEC9048024.1 SUMF1/EgtB/PvdO family nonheme iron enzyme [Planctomycetota bacterium]
MQSTSQRAWTLSLPLASAIALTAYCASQGPSAAHLPPEAQGDVAAANDDTLPSFLLKVPAGDVAMGMEVDAFVQACAEAAFEFNPAKAHVAAKAKFIQAMRRSASVIGRKTRTVPTFYLGKWPVKNSEYQVFVDAERAAGRDVRPPMHWWREGAKDEYEKALPEIRAAFPKTENAALLYWERHGHEVPYKVQDEKGGSIADHPVVYVSWRDANRFAASLGMRLPTEVELTRAMRGDGTHTWPGGEQEDQDKWSAEKKDLLGMAKTTDLKVKPVGSVTGATGPFGHLDLFGQVWQLCGDLGFQPIHGDMKEFVKTWDKGLQKDKRGRLLERKPTWRGNYIIAKGGSYLSYQEPVQLMIDARAPMQTTAVFESMGFRLAKSLQPGYDFLYSLQRIQFDSSAFAKNQELAMDKLVGGERYTIAENGFPSAYEAVAFAPANWLYDEKQMRLKTLNEGSQSKPLLLGAIASTAKFENGTAPGLYSVFFRAAGIPKELRDAVKQGHKAVLKARKEAEKAKKSKNKDDKSSKKPQKDTKPTKWRMVVKRFGLTEDDLAEPKAANGDLGFVRIDEVVIPTDRDSYILSTKGKMVSVFEGTKKKAAFGDPIPATLSVEPGPKGKEDKAVAKFSFGIPLLARNPKKVIVFHMHAPLDQAPPTPDKPWRLPQ